MITLFVDSDIFSIIAALLTAIAGIGTFITANQAKKIKSKDKTNNEKGNNEEILDIDDFIKELAKSSTYSSPKIEESVQKAKENANFIHISKGIIDSKIKSKDDLRNVFSDRFTTEFGSFFQFLQSYQVWLMFTTSAKTNEGYVINNEEILKIKDFISNILADESENRLYDGVAVDDRLSLMAIYSLCKENISYGAIKHELNKLSNSLKNKQEQIKAQWRLNISALVVSLVSLLATIFFSYSSNSTIKESMKELKTDTQTQIFNAVDSLLNKSDIDSGLIKENLFLRRRFEEVNRRLMIEQSKH